MESTVSLIVNNECNIIQHYHDDELRINCLLHTHTL
ncbi:MAG: hypothetical protein ACI90V_010867 [Bacillariaceae sp.]|jgi:hypothetical protein